MARGLVPEFLIWEWVHDESFRFIALREATGINWKEAFLKTMSGNTVTFWFWTLVLVATIAPPIAGAEGADEWVRTIDRRPSDRRIHDPLTELSLHPVAMFEEPAPASVPTTGSGEGGDTELAKKLSNPISSLISVPFQFNFDQGLGPKESDRLTLNVQPVIPMSLNADWNLIVRTIVPIVYQESPATGINSEFGLGDTVQSFFFSPVKPFHGWIWGAGPVFLWPTASHGELGSEKWGAGPTAVLLKQHQGWTYGILANHIWSFAGDDSRPEVNATFLQPFIAHTWPTATTLTLNTESTFDWREDEWTVPLNLSISQVLRIGKQPVSVQAGPRYYLESPDGGPEWGVRFVFTLLFPR